MLAFFTLRDCTIWSMVSTHHGVNLFRYHDHDCKFATDGSSSDFGVGTIGTLRVPTYYD